MSSIADEVGMNTSHLSVAAECRPAKSPGMSGSLQKSGVISRSPGIVKKTPGIEGILLQNFLCARNANFCRI